LTIFRGDKPFGLVDMALRKLTPCPKMNATSDQGSASGSYTRFLREHAGGRAVAGMMPSTVKAWDERLTRVRVRLQRSFGRAPEVTCALEPDVMGTLVREGYAIERLTFQSRPGVRVTANLYRPEPVSARYPGVLSVHGHWAWARMDPHVQPRCIGLAKLGYVVLCVDAFGAGERAIEPGPGTYHGALVGASLWPVGTPLLGLQAYDNRRAVDYLASRPDVDPTRLAITGASGGGNQTLYAGATDERLGAVIPVCGIGTYDAYLATACCVCEVNVSGAAYTTTGDLLAMVAPRALLVVSATRDAFQFSVGESAKSVAYARGRFASLGAEAKLRHVSIESGHDYNRAMRQAMYGWVEKWLRGRGDGQPIPEPEIKTEEVAAIRCFADGQSRPKTIVTIPEFAWREGQARLEKLPRAPDHIERWLADSERMRAALRDEILGGFPSRTPLMVRKSGPPQKLRVSFTSESDIRLQGTVEVGARPNKGTALLISDEPEAATDGGQKSGKRAETNKLKEPWHAAGFSTVELSCRALPTVAPIAGATDHTVAEWGLWVGRPLLGQWVWDIIRWLDCLDQLRLEPTKAGEGPWAPARPFVLIGLSTMSLPALLAAALDARVAAVHCTGGLVSFVGNTTKPWIEVPMGLLAPNILDVVDVSHLAALVAPRPLAFTRAIEPEGGLATPDRTARAFAFARSVYQLIGAADRIRLAEPADLRTLLPHS
jgi:dienelactone hydrolase